MRSSWTRVRVGIIGALFVGALITTTATAHAECLKYSSSPVVFGRQGVGSITTVTVTVTVTCATVKFEKDKMSGGEGGLGVWLSGKGEENPKKDKCAGKELEKSEACNIIFAFEPAKREAYASTYELTTSVGLEKISLSGTGTDGWIVAGKGIGGGEKTEIDGSGWDGGQMEFMVTGINVDLYCADSSARAGASNVLEEAGKLKSKIEYGGCSVSEVSKAGGSAPVIGCKLEESFASETEGELTGPGEVMLKPVTGENVFVIEKVGTGSCAIEGKYQIIGTQVCTVPASGVGRPLASLACTPGGSGLTLEVSKEPIRLYSTELLGVASGGSWRST